MTSGSGGGYCKHCGRKSPIGYITCGKSECQEQEYYDSKRRVKRKGRR